MNFTVSGNTVPPLARPVTPCLEATCEGRTPHASNPYPKCRSYVSTFESSSIVVGRVSEGMRSLTFFPMISKESWNPNRQANHGSHDATLCSASRENKADDRSTGSITTITLGVGGV